MTMRIGMTSKNEVSVIIRPERGPGFVDRRFNSVARGGPTCQSLPNNSFRGSVLCRGLRSDILS